MSICGMLLHLFTGVGDVYVCGCIGVLCGYDSVACE